MNRNFCCSPRVASHNSRSCADCLKMHPGVTQVQTPKTEQIIHDACEVQVDIFSSFKVRLLQLEHEARRRRAGFETISLPLPSYIIKKMSGWARQLRRVLHRGEYSSGSLWMLPDVTFWGKNWDSISNMWGAIQGSGRPASAFQLEFPRTAITAILQSAVKAQTQHV